MKTSTGTLHLLKSVRPPVFRTPMKVVYVIPPTKGQAFLFGRGSISDYCNLSTVQHVYNFYWFQIVRTLNSWYFFRSHE